jgi:hypothetical protein
MSALVFVRRLILGLSLSFLQQAGGGAAQNMLPDPTAAEPTLSELKPKLLPHAPTGYLLDGHEIPSYNHFDLLGNAHRNEAGSVETWNRWKYSKASVILHRM